MRLVMDLDPRHAAGVLAGLVQSDLMQIADAGEVGKLPVLKGLQDGTIKYRKADPNEEWLTWEQVKTRGTGDCEDLTTAVASELISAGIPARPVAYQAQPGLWHVVVQVEGVPGVEYIDPSREGGMGAIA